MGIFCFSYQQKSLETLYEKFWETYDTMWFINLAKQAKFDYAGLILS